MKTRVLKFNILFLTVTVIALIVCAFFCIDGVTDAADGVNVATDGVTVTDATDRVNAALDGAAKEKDGGAVCATDSAVSFVISYADGIWILSAGDGELERFEGRFFGNADGQTAAGEVFLLRIRAELAELGRSEYALTFNLPSVDCTVSGQSVFDYNEHYGRFALIGSYTPVISSGDSVIESLQYRTEDGDFENFAFIEPLSGGLAFGRGVDVGSYFVRFVVTEEFHYDGKVYRAERYSREFACSVQKATPAAPDTETVSVEYGTKAADFADALPADKGTWALSREQTDSAVFGDAVLHVREGAYCVKFDYTPLNQNYGTLPGVDVDVRITPKTLRVVVSDAFSLAGAPLSEDISYRVTSELVGGDSVENLNVTLLTDAVNTSVPGQYTVKASFGNPDYMAYSMNERSMFIEGGLYTVYAVSKNVTAPDGVTFEILLGEGFIGLTLRIELCRNEWFADEPIGGSIYRFIFENSNGERVYPDGGFTLKWEEGTLDKAARAIVIGADGYTTNMSLEDRHLTVPGDTGVIAFFAEAQAYAYKLGGTEIACIVIGTVCIALLIALAVLVALLLMRRNGR